MSMPVGNPVIEFMCQSEIWDTIPADDRAELNQIIEGWYDDLEHMDNLRVARIGDSAQEKEYWRMADSGCCGSMDIIHMCSSARQYRLGCNYGH